MVTQILVWDPGADGFVAFSAALPPAFNTLAALDHGDAFWIEVAQGAIWEQPAADAG